MEVYSMIQGSSTQTKKLCIRQFAFQSWKTFSDPVVVHTSSEVRPGTLVQLGQLFQSRARIGFCLAYPETRVGNHAIVRLTQLPLPMPTLTRPGLPVQVHRRVFMMSKVLPQP